MFDLALHGKAYVGELAERWIYVKDGKISKVSKERVGRAFATIELDDAQFLIPAATDLHVHLRDWSQSEKETVETGTKSALAGGVTTVAEMPNTKPRLDTGENVEARVGHLRERSYVDFAVHAAVPSADSELPGLQKAGAFALKLYPPELSRFPSLLKGASSSGLKMVVHAEDEASIGSGRSPEAELISVMTLIRQGGPRSHVRFAHLSTVEAATAVLASGRAGKKHTIEVAPHHLFMDRSKARARIGDGSRVNPQLRSRRNTEGMRAILEDGGFDFYATDHAPHTVEEKLKGAAPGFPGLELALPLFLTKTESLPLMCRMYCEAPASYLGLKKGRLLPGYSADLVVLSRRNWKIDPDRFVSKGRVTPFAGEVMRYGVDHVMIRGSTAYQQGRFFRHSVELVQ